MNKTKVFQKSPNLLKYVFVYLNGVVLNYRRKHRRKENNKLLKEREHWSIDNYEFWQKKELKKILEYTRFNIPYYIAFWTYRADLDYSELENWPIIEKQTIRDNPELFISNEFKRKELFQMHTSGTSGKPMTFWLTRETLGFWYAMYDLRIKNWNGVTSADSYGSFGGQLIKDSNSKKAPFWVWNSPMNQLYFSSYHINENTVEEYISAMFKFDLKYLLGYVSAIYSIAKISKQMQIKVPEFKVIITNAEPLFDYQRETIEEVFKCKVVQTYSGCEFAFGGNEDLSGKMYLWPEAGVMEVYTEDCELRNYGAGEFVITGFLNKAMPLIRYRVGDFGTISKAEQSNSRPFKVLTQILGRTDDLVKSSEGNYVGRLDPVFKGGFNISEAQIIQETLREFTINIVPLESYKAEEGEEIIERLKDRVGANVSVNLNIVKSIPKGANGKFKAVISKLT